MVKLMSPSADLLERLNDTWNENWGEAPPVAHDLRVLHSDRWVRFHSLPESKRYAETEAEYATVLLRHHAVLDELGASGECFVISARFTSDDVTSTSSSGDVVQPGATHWRTIEGDDYLEGQAQLYASLMAYPSSSLDSVLRAAADWQLAWTIIGPPDLRWLYHPYDGGADIIAPSSIVRDHLKDKFAAWLSSHPGGL
jgi:hypothetical protein